MIRPIDRAIGERIQSRRAIMRMSWVVLAARVGVSEAQIRKYESGAARVPATVLYDIAQIQEKPISWYFEGGE